MWGKLRYFLIFVLLLASLGVRFYKIDNPVADWHSWRQADTAAVARNFDKFGFTPLLPRYDDLSDTQSGKENPQGYRLVEFPLYQTVGYFFFKLFGTFSLEVWLRLVNIIASFVTALLLYLLVAKYVGKLEGWATFFVFSFLPYSIYFSRAILPEMFGVFLSVLAIFLLDLCHEKKNKVSDWLLPFLGSAFFASLALLVKPTTVFLLIPLAYLFFKNREKFSGLKFLLVILNLLTIILPLLLWRVWISRFPEGIPANEWLLNGGNIRFTGAFFRWLLAERLGRLILGFGGLLYFFLGIAKREQKTGSRIFLFFLLGTILYSIVFARGNVQHDYYQIVWLPTIAVFTGIGSILFLKLSRNFLSSIKVLAVFLLATFMMFAFSWYEIRTFYWVNHPEIVEAGKRVDILTPPNAKVIAAYEGDTAFLYQTKRQGWPVVTRSIPEMVKMGAQFLAIVNPDQPALDLEKSYPILERGEKYVIFDLR